MLPAAAAELPAAWIAEAAATPAACAAMRSAATAARVASADHSSFVTSAEPVEQPAVAAATAATIAAVGGSFVPYPAVGRPSASCCGPVVSPAPRFAGGLIKQQAQITQQTAAQ